MKYFNKITSACCFMALALFSLAGCEGGEIFEVNAPNWISEKVDSIADSQKTEDEVLEGMQEDVYTIGSIDYTSAWWTAFSKYYVIPDGDKWNAVFNLHINPDDNSYYKNFALIITNDEDRGAANYAEYGAIRFDATGDSLTYNSQWGSYLYFKFSTSSLILSPTDNQDANVQSLGGKVTLTVDRTSESAFTVKMTNGVATKTYAQPYKETNLNADAANTNIRCFIVPEGSYIDFQQTNIVPIGGLTSADDKDPVSMELQNVPEQVNVGTSLDSAMINVTALVTFEEGVTKTVPASELSFSAIPDMDTTGEKVLVAVYNKTFKGENCEQPVITNATFQVVEKIEYIEITNVPSRTKYYYYTSKATESLANRTMAFDPTDMVVTAKYANGESKVIDNSKLRFSSVPAKEGKHKVVITAEEVVTSEVEVEVAESVLSVVTNSSPVLGAEDCSSAWWTVFSDDFKVPSGETKSISFTNYSSMAGNWNNYVVILRKEVKETEYAVVRADNYGWGDGYAACQTSGGQSDWTTWLNGMNGAKVTVYVTNCGNGTADVQVVMQGTDGTTSIQYYLGINTIDPNDLYFALTVDGSCLVFDK